MTPVLNRLRSVFLLGASAAFIHAQVPDLVVNSFDNPDEALAWSRWWGAANQTYEHDPNYDADNNSSTPGSLRATIDFDLAAFAGDNQFALVGGFPDNAVIDATQYTNLVFDLRWDATSPKNAAGNFGSLEFGFRRSDFSQYWLSPASPYTIQEGDEWVRITAPIDPAAVSIDQISGIVFKLWSGNAGGLTGTSTFWVDNIHLEGKTDTSIAPPTVSIEPVIPGLNIFASAPGSQYQRQNIRTVDPIYSWIGASGPVTYSFNIADYPGAENPGFQTHLFLVPGEGINESSPDWNQPNVIFLDIQNTAEGTANATFRYKVNTPGANAMFYNADPAAGPVGSLASISSPDVRGTWRLTFANDNNVTLTTPSGTSTNFALPADDAALFADPLYIFLGVQPNQLANINQSATFTAFNLTGTATPITENFAGVAPDPEIDPEGAPNLDPAIWQRVAENAAGVVLVPPTASYWINWTVPAPGFRLQHSDSVTGPWEDVATTATQIGDRMRALVTAGSSRGFYRLTQ